jgi:hypothetical protein
MSRWWRAYDDALHDPKVQRLPPHLFKTWFNLLCVASKHDGRLPKAEDIAFLLRRRVEDVRRDVAELCARHLLDVFGDAVAPHNWDTRQYKSDLSTQRVKDHRERSSNVSPPVTRNVSETPPETETETETKDAAPPPDLEKQLYDRGKEVLGEKAGGLIKSLLKAKNGDTALARAAIETASTKSNPREYIGAIARGPKNGNFNLMSGIEGIV